MGEGPWHIDCLSCVLVPGSKRAEADDRPVSLRGRRQSGSNFHTREKSCACKGTGTQRLELPEHLAGRSFSVVVHGDAAGVENLTRMLVDWLTDMELIPAGSHAGLGRYVGYYAPYATSHDALDRDESFQIEVKNQALALVEMVRQIRKGTYRRPDDNLEDPRKK